MRIALALLLFLLPAGARAAPADGHVQTGSGLHFFSGDDVRVSDQRADSVFAAGNSIEITAGEMDNVFAAGNAVRLTDAGVQDAVLAGRSVAVTGAVGDDVIAAGERVEVDAAAGIGGDGVYAGRLVRVSGHSRGDVIAAAARIELAGQIDGDVTLFSPDIVLTPGLAIGGTLTYSSPSALTLPDGVTVAGGVVARPWPEDAREGESAVGGIAGLLFAFAAFTLFAAAIMAAAPGPMAAAARAAAAPWQSLGAGLVTAVGLPIVALAACLTVIGLPLGLFIFMAGALGFGAAAAIGWRWLGERAFRVMKRPVGPGFGERVMATAFGIFLFVGAGLVPVAGTIAQCAIVLLGYGAAAMALLRDRRTSPAEARQTAAM